MRQPSPIVTLPMKHPCPIAPRAPIRAPGITCTKCHTRVPSPITAPGSTTAVGCTKGWRSDIGGTMPTPVPKRPPRLARELKIPADLDGVARPHRAWQGAGGALWLADGRDLLAGLADASVDLVVADPPYAIAKEDWDEFESIDAYVAWCDAWLVEVARVLRAGGSAYVCGFSEILAEVKAR